MAVAIRNRWRRQQLGDDMRQEVAPKNIMMIGPTGVGKTEIARRLAKLTGAPFIKVEATRSLFNRNISPSRPPQKTLNGLKAPFRRCRGR